MAGKDYSVNIGYPVKDKNSVLPLINGEESWRYISEYIKSAQKSIHLCFWAIEGDLELIRNINEVFTEPKEREKYMLINLLGERKKQGVKIRILLWRAPYDSHSVVAKQWNVDTMIRLAGATGIFELLFQPHPTSTIGSWHQKTIIIDDTVAFVGGMNAKQLDWDTSEHLAFNLQRADHRLTSAERRTIDASKDPGAVNKPRHDYMSLITGELVSDVQANFVERWNYCISQKYDYFKYATRLDPPSPSQGVSTNMKAQIVRTVPSYEPQPQGEKGILETYLNAIRLAEKYIYIEDQYFRSETIAQEIADAVKKNSKLLVIIATIPAYLTKIEPDDVVFKIASGSTYWTAKSYNILKAVIPNFTLFYFQSTSIDNNHKRIYVPIDLHAKLMIVDDEWYTIGSCNINERGFRTEGELNVAVQNSSAKELRKKILSFHLNEECPDDIDKAFALWYEHSSLNYKAWKGNYIPKSFVFPFNQWSPLLPMTSKNWL